MKIIKVNKAILQNQDTHYQWLDFLRFLAALLVVLGHVRGFIFQEFSALELESRNFLVAIFYGISRLGHESVIIFFVLSGYLVGGKAFERIGNGTFRPHDYAIDRVTRIWIPLIPALVLSGLVATDTKSPAIWIGNLFGLQGVLVPPLGKNDPLWSLAYEIWFYVLVYACGRLVFRRKMDVPAVLLIILTALVFTKLEVQYLVCWLIGAWFYVKPHQLSTFPSLFLTSFLSAVAIAGLQLVGDGSMALVSGHSELRIGFELLLAVGVGAACVTLVTIKPSKISTFFSQMAAFSYTLYLTHYPLLILLRENGWQRIVVLDKIAFLTYVIIVLACILFAWVIYMPFERNTSRVRAFFKFDR